MDLQVMFKAYSSGVVQTGAVMRLKVLRALRLPPLCSLALQTSCSKSESRRTS